VHLNENLLHEKSIDFINFKFNYWENSLENLIFKQKPHNSRNLEYLLLNSQDKYSQKDSLLHDTIKVNNFFHLDYLNTNYMFFKMFLQNLLHLDSLLELHHIYLTFQLIFPLL
jgi:hypothetical protein